MLYPVSCECGKKRKVSSAQAGIRYTCECGRVNELPSLSELKQSVGRAAGSVEYRLSQMLKCRMLPEGRQCLLCQETTEDITYCWATCERPQLVDQKLLALRLIGQILKTLILGHVEEESNDELTGNDLRFRLPMRVCVECVDQLRDIQLLKLTLLDVPVYAELIDRYPATDVSLDFGLADLTPRG